MTQILYISAVSTCHITSYAFPDSVYFRTVQHTHTNKGKSSQFRYDSVCFGKSNYNSTWHTVIHYRHYQYMQPHHHTPMYHSWLF